MPLLTLLGLSILAGTLVGYSVFHLSKKTFEHSMVAEAETLLELTQAYVSTYSEIVGEHAESRLPVPAAFRATAARLFNASHSRDGTFRALMVGMPGREIATPPVDELMVEKLQQMADRGSHTQYSTTLGIGGEQVLRTVVPSLANSQSCVTCHNDLQGERGQWKQGEMMGAYIIDRGINRSLRQLMMISIAFGILFTTVLMLGVLLSRHNGRLRQQKLALQVLADTDPLTGCLNRRAMLRMLTQRSTSSDSEGGAYKGALLMMDIDHFKRINDQYGHDAGDEVLVQFCQSVRQCIRSNDALARFGGEEFVVYLDNVTPRICRDLAHRICKHIADSEVSLGDETLKYTVSVGGVSLNDFTADAVDKALNQSDKYLYQAKKSGRNRVLLPFALEFAMQ